MNDVAQKIAQAKARASKPRMGRVFRRDGVRDTAELRRICGLLRREPEHASPEDCEALSDLLRVPGAARTLKPVQAAMLAELVTYRASVASICAGGGKTDISYLAPDMLAAKRALLLVPSGLVADTHAKFAVLKTQWSVSHVPTVYGYEMLSRDASAGFLSGCSPKGACASCATAYATLTTPGPTHLALPPARAAQVVQWCKGLFPDVIIADEAQRLKHKGAAVTKRVRRYLDEHPETIFVPLSGTLIGASLEACAHLYEWAMKDGSPLPRRHVDIKEWGLAIDEDVPPGTLRYCPGALAQLYSEDEAKLSFESETKATRLAVQRRIRETPGVISTQDSYGGALRVRVKALDVPRPEVDAAIAQLEATWATPDGHPVADAVAKWRHTLELGCGFFYVWDPRPPNEWLIPRRTWSSTCRHILAHNHRKLDSELQVANAIRRGDYDGEIVTSNGIALGNGETVPEIYRAWADVRDTFEPRTRAEWIDDAPVRYARDWLKDGPGIIFVGFVALGQRIAKDLGLAYYGQGGELEHGKGPKMIADTTPAARGIVASLAANYTGRNLQAWQRALVIPGTGSAALNATLLEQLLARLHREGQKADEVEYEILITCARARVAYDDAVSESATAEQLSGQRQRILFADVLDDFASNELHLEGQRWNE